METSIQCYKSYSFILTNFWHNRKLAYTTFWSKFPKNKKCVYINIKCCSIFICIYFKVTAIFFIAQYFFIYYSTILFFTEIDDNKKTIHNIKSLN